MVEKSKLDEDPQGKAVDPTRYRGMIDTFMYLTSSRSDLVFVMCMCVCVPRKKETFQVIIDVTKNSTCFKAFTISAEVPEIFMQQFWYIIKKVQGTHSYEFLLANKKCRVDAEVFRKILDICPRVEESYQMFIKYSTGQIPPKKSKGKGSQGKKTVDVSQETVDVSEESGPKPAKKTTSRRVVKKKVTISATDNIIPDPDVALDLGRSISLTEAAMQLKGVQSLTPEEQEAANTMKPLKESKKTNKRHSGTRGSSEGTSTIPRVLDEPTIVSATSHKGTCTKPEVLDEEKDISKANVILEWESENESEHSDDSQLNFDDEEKKDKDGDADDEGDDHISDTQDTYDEDAKTESDADEIHKYKICMCKDVDVEIPEPETVEHENKEKDVMTDAAKLDVEKSAKEKGDDENVKNAAGSNYQVKKSTKFPLPCSSLSVSYGFASTAISPPQVTSTILIVQQTTTPIPTPPIATESPTIITVILEFDALTAVQLRVAKLEKDVSELKNTNLYVEALATLNS
nr:hypothetical protein [Tanacetum cinerariifolium]